jgi:hypothetical protein
MPLSQKANFDLMALNKIKVNWDQSKINFAKKSKRGRQKD